MLIVGIGGLGCPVALALARAGIGRLGLVDGDAVDRSNLHRQLFYRETDVGLRKAVVAAEAVRRAAPGVDVRAIDRFVDEDGLSELGAVWDLWVDATDRPATKFAINRAAYRARRPWVHAGATGFSAQVLGILPGESACLACLFPEESDENGPSCHEAGILGPLVGFAGALEARLVRDFVDGRSWANRLHTIDAASLRLRTIDVSRDVECSACGDGENPRIEERP